MCASHGTGVVLTVRALVERGRCNGRYTPTRGWRLVTQWLSSGSTQLVCRQGW
jgi:hypothetical protein